MFFSIPTPVHLPARMSLQVATPAQRLTTDLLWHIFGHVSDVDPNGPMSVSQVSRCWRMVALNSPFIWRNVTLQLHTSLSPQKHTLASAYFKRSQNVSITLTIEATRCFDRGEMKLLVPHAHRIRSLHIKVNTGSLANILWTEMNMPMTRLEVFETVIVSDTSRISVNRKIDTTGMMITNIIPPCEGNLVRWSSWNPTGLTSLILDTTNLWNKPDLDDIHHVLATTCGTIQHVEYKGLVSFIDNAANTRSRLVFPALRSLTVLSHDNMVPLLELMIIPALDSLILRDFIVYPTSPPTPATESDEPAPTPDPDGFLQAIKQWTTIKHLAIFGVDDLSDNLSPPPTEMLSYVKSLDRLTSLELYGIGAATSIAHTLFRYDQTEEPLLPQLSRFLVAIVEMPPNDDLCHYLIARKRHKLPRFQKLSINLDYVEHLSELNRMEILRDSSDENFVFADPELGKYIPIQEVSLLEW